MGDELAGAAAAVAVAVLVDGAEVEVARGSENEMRVAAAKAVARHLNVPAADGRPFRCYGATRIHCVEVRPLVVDPDAGGEAEI